MPGRGPRGEGQKKGRGVHEGDKREVREGKKFGEHAFPLFFPSATWPRTGEPNRTCLKRITNTKCLVDREDGLRGYGLVTKMSLVVLWRGGRKTVCNELIGKTVNADSSFQEI